MNDIDAIRLFLYVAEDLSFVQAARRLGVSPTVATRKIATLEATLATRLFTRSTRRVSLTQEGLLFSHHARRITDVVDQALEASRSSRQGPSGRLRILASTGLGRHLILPHLDEFRRRYPSVGVGLEMSADAVLDVGASGCDLGVMTGHFENASMLARPLMETDSQLFASPAYLERYGAPAHPDDLGEHECLTIVADTGTASWNFSRQGRRFRSRIRAAVAVNDPDSLMIGARAGLGIVMVPDWLALDDVQRGALVQVLPEFCVEPRGTPIHAVYPSKTYLPVKVRAFLDFLVEKSRVRFASTTI
jgi:DNA-binding transcriptional LysR family regulator